MTMPPQSVGDDRPRFSPMTQTESALWGARRREPESTRPLRGRPARDASTPRAGIAVKDVAVL